MIHQHPKQLSFDSCDLVFTESWHYETYLKTNSQKKNDKCKVCEKELEWQNRHTKKNQ